MIELTKNETDAINSLRGLAKRWPDSLMIFCSGGSISIRKNGNFMDHEVGSIAGIRNDGGDGGDFEPTIEV